jgi:hypothetical protein
MTSLGSPLSTISPADDQRSAVFDGLLGRADQRFESATKAACRIGPIGLEKSRYRGHLEILSPDTAQPFDVFVAEHRMR